MKFGGSSATMRCMRKHTTLDLDQDLLRDAAMVLGTRRTTDTVHAALRDVVARRRRAFLANLDFADLTPEVLSAMRRGRTVERPPAPVAKALKGR